jgi:predicted nuclease of predicted toxin-antitoxin system
VPQHDRPKLYLDEHMSQRIATQLRKYGFDAITLHERGMLSEDDREQLTMAVSEQRAIVNCNFGDYVGLDEEYAAVGKQHWGVLLTTEEPTGVLIRRLLKLLNSLSADDLKNQIRWLNEFK